MYGVLYSNNSFFFFAVDRFIMWSIIAYLLCVDGHLVVSSTWLLWIKRLWTFLYMCLWWTLISQLCVPRTGITESVCLELVGTKPSGYFNPKFLRGRRTFHIHSYLWFVEDPISCQRVGNSERHKEFDCKRKETVKGIKKREETGLQRWDGDSGDGMSMSGEGRW